VENLVENSGGWFREWPEREVFAISSEGWFKAYLEQPIEVDCIFLSQPAVS
jgi:hypothetical protein